MQDSAQPGRSTLPRPLGLLVTCGFERVSLAGDLRIAATLGATVLEILPHWRSRPDPAQARDQIESVGLHAASVHGGWGGQAILADRIDLASLDSATRRSSIDDIKRCGEWTLTAGARLLVVHPGGLSDPVEQSDRRAALIDSLSDLTEWMPPELLITVENMPPGVYPGSRMADLAEIVESIGHPDLGLIVDTGHARMVSSPEEETRAARRGILISTHVHDNDGRKDSHAIPGEGVIDWPAWLRSLDQIGYRGPLILECIRAFRERSEADLADLSGALHRLLGIDPGNL